MKNYFFTLLLLSAELFAQKQNDRRNGATNNNGPGSGNTTVVDNRKKDEPEKPKSGITIVPKSDKPTTTVVDHRAKPNTQNGDRQVPSRQRMVSKPTAAFVFNPNSGKYSKTSTAAPIARPIEPFVLLNKEYKWYLGNDEKSGFVGRIAVRDKEMLASTKKNYLYKVNISDIQGYPYYKENDKQKSAPDRPFALNKLVENQNMLGFEQVKSDGLKGEIGKTNVFYFKKIKLGAIALANSAEYLVVTDTLYLNSPGPLNNVIMCVQAENRPYLKFIANTIIYEGPIQTVLMGESDIVLASNNVYLSSKFENLASGGFLKKNPPIMHNADTGNKNHHYFNTLSQNDKILLNRLNVKLMKSILEVELNLAANSWVKDKLIDKFQTLRMRTYRETLSVEQNIQKQFASACDEFDRKFGGYKVEPLRSLNSGIDILAKRNPDQLPTIKYFAIPSLARVKALQNDTTSLIGTIKFNPTGDVKLTASMQVQLTHTDEMEKKVQSELDKYGILMEKTIPQDVFSVSKQPLKIMGKTMGEIIPISNSLLNFEINLPEETKTLLEIFPKDNAISIPVEFKIAKTNQTLVKNIPFVLGKVLAKKLDFSNVMKSFDVFEKNTAIKEIKLSSNLFASQANEGPLDFVEVALEINSGGKSIFRGPFSLSSYNTLAANMIVPFLSMGPDFTITVSGRAIYENGTRDIEPFTTSSEVITIDEQIFKKL